MILFIHQTTRSRFYKTLECVKIQIRTEMWNRDVQDICTKAKGKLDLLFEAWCMRTINKMQNLLGFKDIFLDFEERLWK